MIRRYLPKNLEDLIEWYQRRVAPWTLLAGFIADNILFRVIDFWAMALVLALYLMSALASMFVLNLVTTGRIRQAFVVRITPLFPAVIQWAFGAMFSGFFVLYSESATLAASWISVAILVVLLVANERFRRRYMRFSFQLGILFTAILGFLIFLLPVALNRIGPMMFVASGFASVILIALYLWLMRLAIPELVRENLWNAARNVGVIFLVANILYFTNAIPPLPLALKDAGVYHRIERLPAQTGTGDEYRALVEPAERWRDYLPFGRVFHRASGEQMYVFSSVFAPSGLDMTIRHEWQYHDETSGGWVTTSTIAFGMVGGRDGGFRGYSLSSNTRAGKWRVNVRTESGRIVGRISFTVEDVPAAVELEEKIL